MSKKILLYILIPLFLLLLIGIIIYIVTHRSTSPPGAKSAVMFGLALQNSTDNAVIDLTKLKGKITCFWNWAASLDEKQAKTQYNWDKTLNIQFLPMLWSSTAKDIISFVSDYNYLMLSNEPDMIGGCVGDTWDDGVCHDATSSGYWVTTGEYGCFTPTSVSTECTVNSIVKTPNDGNTFIKLVDNFIDQCSKVSPNVIVVSPVMSQNASGSCNTYQTAFDTNGLPVDTKSPPHKCGENGCVCNGWLLLLRAAALNGTDAQKRWWNDTVKIISIHAYYKYSHHVKSKLLDYMTVFKDDMAKGKKIWLTEVAYVSTTSTNYLQETADFAKSLLYTNTNGNSISPVCPDVSFNIPGDLPGLLTTTPFLFNGVTASWFDHGLTCVTWFCVKKWPNFPTGCNRVTDTNIGNITSYPFDDDGSPNVLYKSLFP
jgi:hypothetical protein